MNAIEIQGLTKRYGPITAVDGLDLTVRQGELFALLGVNGAGKTTTIKMLSCLTRPDGGDARLLGRSIVSDAAGVKRCIGVSPQETAVAPISPPGRIWRCCAASTVCPGRRPPPAQRSWPGLWVWSRCWPAGPGSCPAAGSAA